MLKGFRDFIFRGNVVDLAVAVVIGAAFSAVVDSLVKDIITPVIGLIGGQPDFSSIRIGANARGEGGVAVGNFINALISFTIKAAVIYFAIVVPMKRLTELLKRKEVPAAPPIPSEDIILLREIRDALRNRNP